MTDLYERLRKHENPHEACKFLYNIEIKKMAVELDVSYKHLVCVLNGKIKCSNRLDKDIWEIVNKLEINQEKGN